MTHMVIESDGEKHRVVTLISRASFGPLAQKSLGIKKPFPTEGLTLKQAQDAGEILDALYEKHLAPKKRR